MIKLSPSFIYFLLFPLLGFSQMSKTRIDSLIFHETSKLRNEMKYDEVIALNKKLIKAAESIDYTDGIAWGYKSIGNALCSLGKYKESLNALNKANSISENTNSYKLKAAIAIEIGRNYNEQKVSFTQAIKEFKRGEAFARKIEDEYDRETYLLYSYQSQSSAYFWNNIPDSARQYLVKSFKIEKDAYSAASITHYHLNYSKNIDSIKYYLDLSDRLLNKESSTFEHVIIDNQWGDFYKLKKEYETAIEKYKKALIFAEKSSSTDERLHSLLNMSECYEKLGNSRESVKYLKKYGFLQDSINRVYMKEVSHSVNNIVNSENTHHEEKMSQLQWILMIAIFCAILTVAIILYFFKKNDAKKKELIRKSQTLLSEKDDELHSIQKKINPAFEDLIELAKENHPNFYARFQETYPEIQQKLLQVNPNLEISELTLCAYIYLDFQTKEIADYMYKSIRTIQNRKNRLRKKLQIPSSDDFYIWIKTI